MTEKTTAAKNWTEANVSTLMGIVGSESPVAVATVEAAAAALGKTTRSIASKLRQLDLVVASMAKEKVSTFTPEQSVALADLVNANAGQLTYKEIAEQFEGGAFSPKQVQGKLLALELTGSIKAAEKVEAARSYTEAEEAAFIDLANSGAFIEDIATELDKSVASIRGKALSLTRSGAIASIPKQKESHAKESADPVAALGDKLATMTIAEIALAVDKTERGVKTLMTRRGIDCADYKGAAKKEKAEAKAAA